MFKINVVALPTCGLCKDLVTRLSDCGLPFSIANADDHESLCDMLEVLLKTTSYPIVTFEIPQRVYFISVPDDAQRLGWHRLDDTSTSIGVESSEKIFDVITELRSKINS